MKKIKKIEQINSALENMDMTKMDAKTLAITLGWEIMRLNQKVEEIIERLNSSSQG